MFDGMIISCLKPKEIRINISIKIYLKKQGENRKMTHSSNAQEFIKIFKNPKIEN